MEKTNQPLSVVITTTAPCCLEMEVTVPSQRAKRVYNSQISKIAGQVKLPGFRAGKIPEKILMGRFGAGILAETADELINGTLSEALKDNGYVRASQGEPIDFKSYEVGADYSYKIKVEVEPKFDLPQYKGLQLTKEATEVTEEEIDADVQMLCSSRSTYEKCDDASQDGSMLKVNFCSDADDALKEAEGCKYLLNGENSWMVLREPEMLPGVRTILNGLKAGDKKSADISFPEDFRTEALRGKTLKYDFEVLEVHIMKTPEADDALAKELGAPNLEELRKLIKENKAYTKEKQANDKMKDQIRSLIMNNLDFPLPPTQLKNVVENILKREDGKKDAKAAEESEEVKAEKQAKAEKEAADELRRYYVISAIGEAEDVKVDPADFNNFIEMMASQTGRKADQVFRELQESGRLMGLLDNMRNEKVYQFIIDKANVVNA